MGCSLFLISECLASEFRTSELSQGQGITALGELDLFQCAHAKKDCLAPMLGVMLADTPLSSICPRVNRLIVVEKTGTTPAAVFTRVRAP